MSNSLRGSRLVFSEQRLKDYTIQSIWVSTALALILSLPSLGIFLGLIHLTNNVIIGSLAGFATHFILLAVSPRTSEALLSLFD
jgi:hypothetical protein